MFATPAPPASPARAPRQDGVGVGLRPAHYRELAEIEVGPDYLEIITETVSYTHLTLPTKRIV